MEEELKKELQDLKNQVEHLNQKVKEVSSETEKAKKQATNAASSARGNGDTLGFLALLIIALFAFTTNPSFSEHENHLAQKNRFINSFEAKQAYTSYFLFSTISSLAGDPDEKMITFGIFGNVFEINAP